MIDLNRKVLIVTGTSPIRRTQLEEMGLNPAAFSLLTLLGKDAIRSSTPTIGAASIGGYLRWHGIDVEIRDFYFDEVDSFDANIVGISSTLIDLEDVRQIAELIREKNPSATIVLGGPLSWSVSPEKLLQMVPSCDYIVQREGEQTFLELIHALCYGGDPQLVNGLVFQREDTVIKTPPRVSIVLDSLPKPAWDLMGIPSENRLPILPVEASRGCPYDCAFCSEVSYWGKPVRYRSIDKVVEELYHNVEKFGIKTFRFTDSCFSAPPKRCAAICDAIYKMSKRHGITIKWSSYARINNLDHALLENMKQAGCVALDIGLDSGSVDILRKMGKYYSPKKVLEIAQAARDVNIITNFNVIIGFPGETSETVQATAELINRAAPDTFTCFVFFLAPNTKVHDNLSQYSIEGEGLFWKHTTMTSSEAVEAMATVEKQVSESTSFPGGEHIACYLTSLGYSETEIRDFYQAARELTTVTDEKALLKIKRVIEHVAKYF